jgi:hypothetical protein
MAFSDPLSITVNSVAKSLARIDSGNNYSSEYFLSETTGEYTVKIRHSQFQKDGVVMDRHNVELTYVLYATATTKAFTRKVYTVIENERSDVKADVGFLAAAEVAFLSAGNVTKLLNRES